MGEKYPQKFPESAAITPLSISSTATFSSFIFHNDANKELFVCKEKFKKLVVFLSLIFIIIFFENSFGIFNNIYFY